ncbi:MAG: hypothetical protein ACLFUP_06560 [Desulfobacteraceae bacterium]
MRGVKAIVLAVVLGLFFQAAGCGFTKKIYREVSPDESGLKKRVLVLPVVDQQGLGDKGVEEITAELAELLDKDPALMVGKAEEPIPSTLRSRSSEFGIIVDPDLAKMAEEMGMHVLVTAVVNPLEVIDHGPGLWPLNRIPVWPFTGKGKEIEVSMVVNAVDIVRGTLILTRLERKRLDVPEREDDEDEEPLIVKEKEPRTDDEIIAALPDRLKKEALEEILREQAEAVKEKLREQAWSGRVVSVGGESIVINGGEDVGLAEGDVFEVFRRGESISSATGRSFYLVGDKIGEIRAVKIMDRYAAAEPLEGEGFSAGQLIRPKK